MNVVAIGAHPDDIEIGAGGAVGIHREVDDRVTFIVCTNGGASGAVDARTRKTEARDAASVLDVDDVRFLNFPDTRFPYDAESVQRIESHLDEIDPDRVYVHAETDTHQDHRKVALASITATRKCDMVLSYESPSTRSSYTPNYHVPLPETALNGKIEAIQAHESQQDKEYLDATAMKDLARFRGQETNSAYAESFELVCAVDTIMDGYRRSDGP